MGEERQGATYSPGSAWIRAMSKEPAVIVTEQGACSDVFLNVPENDPAPRSSSVSHPASGSLLKELSSLGW
jgi:hypothetical protein